MQSHINPPAVSLHGDELLYGLDSHGLGVVCLTTLVVSNGTVGSWVPDEKITIKV